VPAPLTPTPPSTPARGMVPIPPSRHRALHHLRDAEPLWRQYAALLVFVLLAFAMLVLANPARAQQPPAADAAGAERTASPYFHVGGNAEPGVDALPLKSTRVDATVLGPIAEVVVTQRYRNEGPRPIEARYVFPGATGAAVHAMQVRLGDRLLVADIREKQAARIEYAQARQQGKTAALLEQQRPNVFQMNVANILPGDDVHVELRYTELLVPRDGEYEFVFPTVVGPRYNAPAGEARSEQWVAQPVLPAGRRPNHSFELNASLLTPLPVADLRSPSHRIELQRPEDRRLDVSLAPADDGVEPPNNRDFVLHYRLAGEGIESGVMLYQGTGAKGDDENFFVAMVQPPALVEAAAVLPRDYVFVVDISGSMHGFPLDTAKQLMVELLGSLRPHDSFNVMLFAGSARTLAAQSVPATQANVAAALQMLRQTGGGGGTEIVPALKSIAALPKPADVARTVVVVTDGYVTVEREVFELVRKGLSGSNVFAFGIGSSVNRHLIEGIARAGSGEAFVVTQPQQAAAQAQRFRRLVEAPLMTGVTARFEGVDVHDAEPRVLPDLLGLRPLVFYGKWRGDDVRDARLVVEGRTAAGAVRQVVPLAGSVSRDTHALRQLWARARIAALSDDEALQGGRANQAPITALGLKYALLTDYTSFIAVDRIVRQVAEAAVTVDQPSPLPQGVSNFAVGAVLPSTPEPGTWAALAVLLAMLTVAMRRSRSGQG
jgi:Ca-activated chloride channel family protein